MVVEVMGRDTGWIPLHSGIAGGGHVTLIPGVPFPRAEHSRLRETARGFRQAFTIVVVAEVIKLPSEMQHLSGSKPVGNMVGNASRAVAQRSSRRRAGHIRGPPGRHLRRLSCGTTRKERGTLMCSVGGKPTEVKVRNLVAWIAGKRETESLAIDKAIFGMVSQSSGRNEQ